MYARTGAALLFILMTGAAALAANERSPNSSTTQSQGTEDEQSACTPDAMKFCDEDIPNTFAVLACLQAHRKRLTKSSRHVLESNGQ